MAEGYDLIIGGKKIEHTKGCEAHSDGDVLLHCITDAILGAARLLDPSHASQAISLTMAIRVNKFRSKPLSSSDHRYATKAPAKFGEP
jgi:2C-methyl-D-erythritol 2,4-cyclodiphosphate synthase